MKLFYSICLMLSLSCGSLFGQITITADDVPMPGLNYLVSSDTAASVDLSLEGPDLLWDWTGLVKHDSAYQLTVVPDDALGNENFPNATFAYNNLEQTQTQFAQVTPTEVLGLGLVSETYLTLDDVVLTLDPPQKILNLPTNYQDTYDADYGFTLGITSFVDQFDSIRVINTVDADVEITSWGTLMLPGGNSEVLLRKEIQESITEIEGLIGGIFWIPIPGVGDTTQTIVYNFLSKDVRGIIAQYTTDMEGNLVSPISWTEPTVVIYPIPTADWDYEYVQEAPLTIQFENLSFNAPIDLNWNFGDGTTSTQKHPEHAFPMAGEYEVCLIASNPTASDTSCQVISIIDSPVAGMTIIDGPLSSGTYNFADNSSGIISSWLWDLGDGTITTVQNPGDHSYSVSGSYEVCLTVSNLAGESMICQTIDAVVGEVPSVSFEYSDPDPVTGTISFTDSSTGQPTSWLWDFGDGNTSPEQNPMHNYSIDGEYEVCLTVSNVNGSTMACQTVNLMTSIVELDWNEYWKIGPNPTSKLLYLDCSRATVQPDRIELWNSLGQKVIGQNVTGTATIDVSGIGKGVFNIRLFQGGDLIGQRNAVVQ